MARASHADPAINALYKARRKAADRADRSGFVGIDGWAKLEATEDKLRALDPDGDWRYEARDYDTHPFAWTVKRFREPMKLKV